MPLDNGNVNFKFLKAEKIPLMVKAKFVFLFSVTLIKADFISKKRT